MKLLPLSFIVVLSAIVCFSTSALAVEDGLGTNVMRNIRVQPAGVIDLGNRAITNWNQVGSTVDVANLQGATNTLNTAVTNVSYQVTNGLYNATNALNTSVTNISYQVTNGLYSATNTLNTAVTNVSYQVTNDLFNATNALNTALTNVIYQVTNDLFNATNALNLNKLDKVGDTAGNLTVTGRFVQAVATSTQIIAALNNAIGVDDTFIPIISDGANVTASIVDGGPNGQVIILQGQSDTATVTLTNNPDQVLLCDDVDFTFKKDNTMQLIWNNGKWAELNRVAQ